jgi:hypothetical protein
MSHFLISLLQTFSFEGDRRSLSDYPRARTSRNGFEFRAVVSWWYVHCTRSPWSVLRAEQTKRIPIRGGEGRNSVGVDQGSGITRRSRGSFALSQAAATIGTVSVRATTRHLYSV